MSQGRFTAQISAQVAKAKATMLAVRNESVQRVLEIAQTPVGAGGNMPVDTGFLRSSLMAAAGQANFAIRPNPDRGKHSYDAGQITLVLAGAPIESPIEAVYTANYARYVEYGARGRPGRRFVGLAAQQWQRVVSEVCAEAQARTS